MIETSRRSLFKGMLALVTAPAIVRVASLMPCAPTEIIRAPAADFLAWNQITREAVQQLKNSNAFLQSLGEQFRGDFEFANGDQWPNAKIGDVLRIRLPNDFAVVNTSDRFMYDIDRRALVVARSDVVRDLQKPAEALALAVAAPVVIEKALKAPVTRRLFDILK